MPQVMPHAIPQTFTRSPVYFTRLYIRCEYYCNTFFHFSTLKELNVYYAGGREKFGRASRILHRGHNWAYYFIH